MTNGSYLTREQIFAALDLPVKDVDVPEWGGHIGLRVMSGTEREEFEGSVLEAKERDESTKEFRAKLVAFCAVDANGERLFSLEHLEALGKKSAVVIDRLADVCLRINAMGKYIEVAEKNSAAGTPGASTSDSASN
jgi:hypothetical protein